jgi:hypothetical protein
LCFSIVLRLSYHTLRQPVSIVLASLSSVQKNLLSSVSVCAVELSLIHVLQYSITAMPPAQVNSSKAKKQDDTLLFSHLVSKLSSLLPLIGRRSESEHKIKFHAAAVGFTLRSKVGVLRYFHFRLGSQKLQAVTIHVRAGQELAPSFREALCCKEDRTNSTSPSSTTSSPLGLPDIKIVRLSKLSAPYPLSNHFVLENPAWPTPPPLHKKDRTCNHCTKYLILSPSQLQHSLSANKSTVFLDDNTGEVVAICIRGLAKDHYPLDSMMAR